MNKPGIELLKEFEGWSGKAYQDMVGVWTIGYGFTEGARAGQTMNKTQGEARLKREVEKYEAAVLRACTVPPNENELAAMTVLAFNIGIAGFIKSTVLKAHNRGDRQSASRAFGLWNRAGNRAVAGLTRRRAAEAALYLAPAGDDPHEMPQAVEEERPMARSPINLLGGGVSAGGALGLLNEQAENASSVLSSAKEWITRGAEIFGLTPLQLFSVAAIAIGVAIIWYRLRQRSLGWV